MHRRTLLAALLALPATAFGAEGMRVLATNAILADMARAVAGPGVAVRSLVPAGADPHSFTPRPSDLEAVRTARLVLRNGLGLEGWLDRLLQAASPGGPVVTASAGITPLTVIAGGSAIPDPHVWQDPRNGEQMVRTIAAALQAADAAQAAGIAARTAEYLHRIAETDHSIEAQYAPIPPARRRIVTSHDAFAYYAARYGITILAAQGVDEESEPSARRIAALVRQMRREDLHTVFLESAADPRLIEALASEAGARIGGTIYADALSPPDGPAATYLDMLRHNTELFVDSMRP